MKNCTRRLFAFLIAAVMFTSLSACASGGNEELISSSGGGDAASADTGADTETSSAEKTKIVFLRAGTEEYKKEAFTELIGQFETEFPEYTVEYQEGPWGDDIETKLNTSFASGTAADVINYSLASMGQRIPIGQYENLNAYTEGWEGLDDIYGSALEAGSVGDDLYGIAYVPDARILAYNTELFEKAGIAAPPTTWEELREAHEKLIVRDGDGNVIQTGFSFPTNGTNINQWLAILGYQNGVFNLVDEATDEILFNTPGAIEAMNFLKELYDMGSILWDASKSDQNPFGLGTGAMAVISTNEFNNFNSGALAGKIKMAPMFKNTSEGTFCGMHFLFMNANSKNKDASWKFMEFLSRKESMSLWSEKVGVPPVRASLEADYLAANQEYGEVILNAVSIGRGAPKIAYSNTLFSIVDGAMEEIYYNESTVEDALNAAAAELKSEIETQ